MKELLKPILKEESIDYIVEHYPSLRHLCNTSEETLLTIPGVGKSKARELKSILEISKQLLLPDVNECYIKNPGDVYSYCKFMAIYEEERMIALYLNNKCKIIKHSIISKGILNSSLAHPREFFSEAVRIKAASVIAVHNHPSGDPTPSNDDINLTKRLKEVGIILGIELNDHVIIGSGKYKSLKEMNVF